MLQLTQKEAVMFKERLKELRKLNGITQKELAEHLGFTHVAVVKWENGQREPDFSTVVKIAKFFNVSTDYLLGKTDEPSIILANEKISVPAQYEDVLVALNNDGEELTQADIEQIVNFIKFTRENRGKDEK